MLKRVPALDGLRGVAVLLVVVSHSWIGPLFTFWPRMGWTGVELFFVLSGFLITGILLDAREAPGYFRNFYLRRVLRVFPLYYFVIAGSFLLAAWLPAELAPKLVIPRGHEWTYWFFLGNFSMARADMFSQFSPGVTWSLAIEEQYYLLWAPVVLLLRGRALVYACGALYVLAILWRSVLFGTHGWILAGLVLLPSQMDGLAVGSLLAVLFRAEGSIPQARRWAPWILAASAAGIVLNAIHAGAFFGTDARTSIVSLALYPLMYGSLLTLAVALPGSAWAAALRVPLLRTFGRYSYAIYLLHYAILVATLVVERYLLKTFQMPGQLAYTALLVSLSLAAGWVSWCLLEQPIQRLKRHFEGGAPGARERDAYTLSGVRTGWSIGPWRFERPELGLGLVDAVNRIRQVRLRPDHALFAIVAASLVAVFLEGLDLADAGLPVSLLLLAGACAAAWLSMSRPGFALAAAIDLVGLYVGPRGGYVSLVLVAFLLAFAGTTMARRLRARATAQETGV